MFFKKIKRGRVGCHGNLGEEGLTENIEWSSEMRAYLNDCN